MDSEYIQDYGRVVVDGDAGEFKYTGGACG